MRVLIVVSINRHSPAPFVLEQMKALQQVGCETELFGVAGRGVTGYLANLIRLKRKIRQFHPDIVHAHYGLSGLLANMQRRIPVVTTYHGSDINNSSTRRLSRIAMKFSAYNVFVSQRLIDLAKPKRNFILLPCGINLEDYPIVEKLEARSLMGLDNKKKYVLFAGAFDNTVKNAPLAQEAVSLLPGVELIELKGYSRHQVALLMQAVDCFLMTSHSEGSPQVIKEAMACGCPIVSVDVGDVKERIENVYGCYVSESRSAECLADLMNKAFQFNGKTIGRQEIIVAGLENAAIADRLLEIYERVRDSAMIREYL